MSHWCILWWMSHCVTLHHCPEINLERLLKGKISHEYPEHFLYTVCNPLLLKYRNKTVFFRTTKFVRVKHRKLKPCAFHSWDGIQHTDSWPVFICIEIGSWYRTNKSSKINHFCQLEDNALLPHRYREYWAPYEWLDVSCRKVSSS